MKKTEIAEVKEDENHAYGISTRTVSTRIDSRGVKFALCEMTKYVSQNANRYLRENPDVKYILIFNGTGKLSARSKGFDLNTLNGLAGHPQAAGGQYAESFLKRLKNGLVKELGYK